MNVHDVESRRTDATQALPQHFETKQWYKCTVYNSHKICAYEFFCFYSILPK